MNEINDKEWDLYLDDVIKKGIKMPFDEWKNLKRLLTIASENKRLEK